MKAPLSAVLITRNAANVLDPCLESLAFVDDIVIVDSGSTDRTAEIARAATASSAAGSRTARAIPTGARGFSTA